jgi:hypothetical protein
MARAGDGKTLPGVNLADLGYMSPDEKFLRLVLSRMGGDREARNHLLEREERDKESGQESDIVSGILKQ